MRTKRIILGSPRLDLFLSVLKREKPISVQAFIPEAAVKLQHTGAQWADDLRDLPKSCSNEKEEEGWESSEDVAQHLAGIVTRLFVKSTCDRDLILTSAAKVVAQNEPKIKAFLEQ